MAEKDTGIGTLFLDNMACPQVVDGEYSLHAGGACKYVE
jgi:hypothetical protein